VDAVDAHVADEPALLYEAPGDPASADNAHSQDAVRRRAQLGAGDALGAIQVDDLAVFGEVVELAQPVRADREDVDAQPLDVVDLLALVLLDDHFVDQSGGFDIADALERALPDVHLAAAVVVLLGRDPDDQVITKCLCAFQQPQVTFVEQVEGAVGDDAQLGCSWSRFRRVASA